MTRKVHGTIRQFVNHMQSLAKIARLPHSEPLTEVWRITTESDIRFTASEARHLLGKNDGPLRQRIADAEVCALELLKILAGFPHLVEKPIAEWYIPNFEAVYSAVVEAIDGFGDLLRPPPKSSKPQQWVPSQKDQKLLIELYEQNPEPKFDDICRKLECGHTKGQDARTWARKKGLEQRPPNRKGTIT